MALTTRSVLKYTLLPGLLPRLRNLFGAGFAHISYLMALIYSSVRLLPADHPYLNSANFGRFGIRHVIAEAANNLKFEKRYADQILIFGLILIALILLFGQFIILGLSIMNQPALAADTPGALGYFLDYLTIPSSYTDFGPQNDIAMVIMDRVFGVPDLFNSCISKIGLPCTDMHGRVIPTPGQYPFPIHGALHALFGYYSYGMMIVGVVIILYFVTTVIGETAVTGTPFGKRFNKAWVPMRLIVFFALIIPLSSPAGGGAGLNSGQYLILTIAKHGSHFATNGWAQFNKILTQNSVSQTNELVSEDAMIARPHIPELGDLAQFMYVVKTCEAALSTPEEPIHAYVTRPGLLADGPRARDIDDFADFGEVIEFSEMGNIQIVFGHQDAEEHALHRGNVKPICGSAQLMITDVVQPGAIAIQAAYFDLIKYMYDDTQMAASARCIADKRNEAIDTNCTLPTEDDIIAFYNDYQEYVEQDIRDAFEMQIDDADFAGPDGLKGLGWGGAAIWYNKIAEMNGAITTAILNIPQRDKYPLVTEEVLSQNRASLPFVSEADQFRPYLDLENQVQLDEGDLNVAVALYDANRFWEVHDITTTSRTQTTGNFFTDTISFIMGTEGLFSLRDNPDINPMAQLSSMGKTMIERAVMMFGVAGLGELAQTFNKNGLVGNIGQAVSGFGLSVGSVSLLLGFMLYYVLPIMPFIYFIFAVSGWVKSVFEAIIAVPLWALAHIRIDGEGLPGQSAANGYFLVMEIFLRPIMIVMGLIAAILSFSAMVMVLNGIFEEVVSTAKGFDINQDITTINLDNPSDLRASISYLNNAVDLFFYSIIYVVLVYISGVTAFKIIDLLPQSILRWMGVSVKTFQEEAGDPAGEMAGQLYKRANITLSVLQGNDPGQTAALIA